VKKGVLMVYGAISLNC